MGELLSGMQIESKPILNRTEHYFKAVKSTVKPNKFRGIEQIEFSEFKINSNCKLFAKVGLLNKYLLCTIVLNDI